MKIHEARYKLENLGCFKDVGVLIDTYEGADALKEGIEVGEITVKVLLCNCNKKKS